MLLESESDGDAEGALGRPSSDEAGFDDDCAEGDKFAGSTNTTGETAHRETRPMVGRGLNPLMHRARERPSAPHPVEAATPGVVRFAAD